VSFTIDQPGEYSLTEDLQTGWIRQRPTGCFRPYNI
jgi:hypothetical protein